MAIRSIRLGQKEHSRSVIHFLKILIFLNVVKLGSQLQSIEVPESASSINVCCLEAFSFSWNRLNLNLTIKCSYFSFSNFHIFTCRNVLAAATPYFHAMFTSGLIESEYEGRWVRGVGGTTTMGKNKQRQRLVLQGIKQKTLEVSWEITNLFSVAIVT